MQAQTFARAADSFIHRGCDGFNVQGLSRQALPRVDPHVPIPPPPAADWTAAQRPATRPTRSADIEVGNIHTSDILGSALSATDRDPGTNWRREGRQLPTPALSSAYHAALVLDRHPSTSSAGREPMALNSAPSRQFLSPRIRRPASSLPTGIAQSNPPATSDSGACSLANLCLQPPRVLSCIAPALLVLSSALLFRSGAQLASIPVGSTIYAASVRYKHGYRRHTLVYYPLIVCHGGRLPCGYVLCAIRTAQRATF